MKKFSDKKNHTTKTVSLNRKNNKTELQVESERLRVLAGDKIAWQNQTALLKDVSDIERGLRMLIEGVEWYLLGMEQAGYSLKDDRLLGQPMGQIIEGLLELLIGPGKFDAGTCEATLRNVAQRYGIRLAE